MAVTDLRDTRVLIPRVRRALDGPTATSSAALSSTLTDEQVNNVVADSIASLLLYSGGTIFGKTLDVVERDDYYSAPIAWMTSQELNEAEQMLVATQAALDYFYRTVQAMKVSERIANADEEWEWQMSAQAVTERLKQLRDDRDKALEAVMGQGNVPEDYISFIAVRDAQVSALIEPWVGAGAASGMEIDWRFLP